MPVSSKINDIDAFRFLYDKYAPALYGAILKLTPDVQIANAVLEKSFLEIWKQRACYNPSHGGHFAFMLRLTLQQCGNKKGFQELFKLPHTKENHHKWLRNNQ